MQGSESLPLNRSLLPWKGSLDILENKISAKYTPVLESKNYTSLKRMRQPNDMHTQVNYNLVEDIDIMPKSGT